MNINININNGYSSLKNLGNTCFLNSCIQVLCHTTELTELLFKKIDNEITNDNNNKILINEYKDLIKLMWSQNGIVSPNRFVHIIQIIAKNKNKNLFTGFIQNDVTEFLQFLIDCLDVDNNVIDDELLFNGKLTSKILNSDKEIISSQNEPFFILNMSIPNNNNPTLNDCIDYFIDYEELDGFNDKTKKNEKIIKKYDFNIIPKILVITLKRFNHVDKNNILVLFDEFIEINGKDNKKQKYELYGVCNHYGNILFGHYTVFIKHMSGKWIHFNDEQMEKIDDFSKIITPNAYCLFFRKINE